MKTDVIQPNVDVFIRDGRIERIESTGGDISGYISLDGTNKYLMPGLADMHVHFINDPKYNVNNAFLFLASGVTTIRVMWGSASNLEMRNKINAGEMLGPKMLVASPGFNGTVPLWPGTVVTNSTEEVRTRVREFKSQGYDYIKVYANLSKDHFDALLDEANKEGIRAIGHLPLTLELNYVMNKKQYSIEHLGGFLTADPGSTVVAQQINVSKENGTWHCPTLIVMNRSLSLVSKYKSEEEYKYLSPSWKSWYEYPTAQPPSFNQAAGHPGRLVMFKRLYDSGVNLISGTDMGIRFLYPGTSLHEELENYVAAGLTPYQALQTSTKNVSIFLEDDKTGVIAVGNPADLVLLDKNPLNNISNVKTIAGVMKSGTWLSKDGIMEVKSLLRKLYE